MTRRPLELVFFASLCKLFRAFLLFIQRKELKDEDLRKGERDYKEREEKQILEDEVIPTHLQVSGTLNPRTPIDVDSDHSEAWSEDVLLNYELNISKGILYIMVKFFAKII